MLWLAVQSLLGRPLGQVPRSLALLALLLLALLASACSSTPNPSPGTPPQASPGTGCRLSVSITESSGTVWGTVTATAAGTTFVFDAATRSVPVACGTTVDLRERPTDSTNWPFYAWRLGSRKVTSTSASTVVNGVAHVDAVFAPAPGAIASPTASAAGN